MSARAMRYVSTRGATPPTTLSEALAAGLAPDGGLYVPVELPRLEAAEFAGAGTLAQVAERLLRPFFVGDGLEGDLDAICAEAFDFEVGSSRVDLQACKLEYSIVSPK